MNVLLKNIDKVNAIIKIQIEQEDYQEKVEKGIKNIRQKANIPGFRAGMAPKSLVKKMYERSVLVEEINRLVGERLYGYIRENNIQILGEPLPNDSEQQVIDFNAQTEFEFCFDIALAPELNFTVSNEDKMPYYQIEITDSLIEEQIKSYTQRFGATKPVDNFEGKDMIKADLVEVDEQGNEIEGGLKVEASLMLPHYFKDDNEKAKIEGVKVGDTFTFNPAVACGGSDAEMAHILKIDKDQTAEHKGDFKATVGEITRFVEAEINEEFFKKVYGEDTTITTEEEFRAKVKETLSAMLNPESEYKFGLDVKEMISRKAGELEYPVEFLKRWLLESKEEKTEEEVAEQMPQMLKELTWHLSKEKIVKENEIKVDEEDLMAIAKVDVRMQFAQYGMNDVPEEYLVQYAQEMLKKQDSARGFVDRAIEEKVFAWVKSVVTLENQTIAREDFYKLLGEK